MCEELEEAGQGYNWTVTGRNKYGITLEDVETNSKESFQRICEKESEGDSTC